MRKTGEIALLKGWLLPHQLQHALELQEQKKEYQDIKLGELLRKSGYITKQQYQLLEEELKLLEKKKAVCLDWIKRYSNVPAEEYGKHLIFTNFFNYLELTAEALHLSSARLSDRVMFPALKISSDVSMVCVRMGSPNIALAIDIFSHLNPRSLFFLGKCGGIKRQLQIGDYILPTSAIRGDGTSDAYLDRKVPSLPAFTLQQTLAKHIIEKKQKYYTGVVHSTNQRLWEFDRDFAMQLIRDKAIAVDMETATFFVVGFANNTPAGALLLVSDLPLHEIKTQKKDKVVTSQFSETHIKIALAATDEVNKSMQSLKHFSYGYF